MGASGLGTPGSFSRSTAWVLSVGFLIGGDVMQMYEEDGSGELDEECEARKIQG